MRSAQCALRNALCAMRSAQCALLIALCSLRFAQCALLIVLCSLRSAQCAPLNALCSSYIWSPFRSMVLFRSNSSGGSLGASTIGSPFRSMVLFWSNSSGGSLGAHHTKSLTLAFWRGRTGSSSQTHLACRSGPVPTCPEGHFGTW